MLFLASPLPIDGFKSKQSLTNSWMVFNLKASENNSLNVLRGGFG